MTTVVLATHQTSLWPHLGGSTWVRLQYLLGLRRLGCEVVWIDRLRALVPPDDPHSLDHLQPPVRAGCPRLRVRRPVLHRPRRGAPLAGDGP